MSSLGMTPTIAEMNQPITIISSLGITSTIAFEFDIAAKSFEELLNTLNENQVYGLYYKVIAYNGKQVVTSSPMNPIVEKMNPIVETWNPIIEKMNPIVEKMDHVSSAITSIYRYRIFVVFNNLSKAYTILQSLQLKPTIIPVGLGQVASGTGKFQQFWNQLKSRNIAFKSLQSIPNNMVLIEFVNPWTAFDSAFYQSIQTILSSQ